MKFWNPFLLETTFTYTLNYFRSKSRSASRSRSNSPAPSDHRSSTSSSHDRFRKRSKTPPQRSSPKPIGRSSFARNDSRGDRDNSRRRSITPPPTSFSMGDSTGSKINESIDQSNKGHQMLKKMGWVSGGIGGGISEPIHPGQVRDKQDLYKVK